MSPLLTTYYKRRQRAGGLLFNAPVSWLPFHDRGLIIILDNHPLNKERKKQDCWQLLYLWSLGIHIWGILKGLWLCGDGTPLVSICEMQEVCDHSGDRKGGTPPPRVTLTKELQGFKTEKRGRACDSNGLQQSLIKGSQTKLFFD